MGIYLNSLDPFSFYSELCQRFTEYTGRILAVGISYDKKPSGTAAT